MQEVFDFMAKLQRAPVVTVKDASWFPQPERKQLDEAETEGTDEEPV
jgi:hypothetical protein